MAAPERGRRLDGLALRPEFRPKPEGRRRASTREAMSQGEQSSTCRASFFGFASGLELSIVVPETCRAVERRLAVLGVVADGPEEETAPVT